MTWLKSMLLMRFNDPSPNRVVFVPGCRCQQRTHKRLATMMLKGTALTFERQGSRSRFLFALRLSLSLSLSYLQRGAYFLFLWLPPRAGMRRLCRRNTSLHSSQPCNIYLCINKVFFSFLISLLVLVLLTLAHAHPPLWNRTPADDTQITLIFSPSLCIYNITYASIIYTKRKMPYGVARERFCCCLYHILILDSDSRKKEEEIKSHYGGCAAGESALHSIGRMITQSSLSHRGVKNRAVGGKWLGKVAFGTARHSRQTECLQHTVYAGRPGGKSHARFIMIIIDKKELVIFFFLGCALYGDAQRKKEEEEEDGRSFS